MPESAQGLLSRALCTFGFGSRQDPRYDAISSSRFHRILRRGREYGWAPTPEEASLAAAPGAPEVPTGLHFVCLNADIARQFEFVQSAWLSSSKFDGLTGEADPLLGNRVPLLSGEDTDAFGRLAGLPPFVTVRGGAYFFLPGLRALRFISSLPAG